MAEMNRLSSVFWGKNQQRCSLILFTLVAMATVVSVDSLSLCLNTVPIKVCGEGDCVNGTCVCFPGWSGEYCEQCSGRIRLDPDDGIIYDGGSVSYPKDRMCSWILDTRREQGTSLRLVFNEFESECGWDHFYIHNGDSVFAPLVAAYSGLLLSKGENSSAFELNIRLSGRYGFFHFYSDAAYVMSGFNISYSVGGCYLNCSQQGMCVDGECQCDAGFGGDGCEVDLNVCPQNCSDKGTCSGTVCVCSPGNKGEDCSLTAADTLWERLVTKDSPKGRASHVALLDGDLMWVVGGYSLSDKEDNRLLTYNISSKAWSQVTETAAGSSQPWPLYAHSAVMFENKLYVHGGVRDGRVMDELWVFDIANGNWTQLKGSGYPVSGHTAHVSDRSMLVFFGYSPIYGYMNHIQQYDFDVDEWSVVETTGSVIQGGYGHASVHDEVSSKVYIFGGYHSHSDATSASSYNLTDKLYVYDLITKEWLVLMSSGHPRYLHSMVSVGDYLLVFGGNTHNDTSKSRGAKCFSSDFMLYDIKCNSWHLMPPPQLKDAARFGQSLLVYNSSLYMFGGFDSVVLNDVIRVELGDCGSITNDSDCQMAVPGMRCWWDQGTCQQRSNSGEASDVCEASAGRDFSVCPGLNTCKACLSTSCTWCGNNCTSLNCTLPQKVTNDTGECLAWEAQAAGCILYHTCQACQDDFSCMWDSNSCKPRTGEAANTTANRTELQAQCAQKHKPCWQRDSCSSCTQNSCMWCSNLAVCIDTNAYVASFPYAQCMDWTTKHDKCNATQCVGRKSCGDCLLNSKCGWCNGPDDNGLGVCMDGGMAGPISSPSSSSSPKGSGGSAVAALQCAKDSWFFTKCPQCQCNGHSTCSANSSRCQSCQFPTRGDKCQYCKHFYYGNPANGGNCSECQCHGQADSCNPLDGKCYCHTRGVTGKNCDSCDDAHKYFGDPKSGGTCYYRLSTEYQYTFNLSKKEDVNYTQINFLSIPGSSDRDVDFTLNCSGLALINITFKSKSLAEEQVITSNRECDYFRTKFEHKDHSFGGDSNSTFYVHIFAFKTPFWLQISFSQFPKIDLVHFFITFFSCFLSLVLIAAALWKIKHKYDSYRRRQQQMVEMQQMASRPFSSVCVDVEKRPDPAAAGLAPERKELRDHVDSALRRRKKLANKPSAIAIEPMVGNKAAVLTLLVQLPFADSDYAPSGQSGMAVASALVSIGTTRKQSLEHVKGDKPKIRKHLLYTHPDTFA